MRPWVLMDVSWLAYRALHAVGHLENDDFPTGIIFGFFTQLRLICLDPRVQSNKVCLFFDSRKSKRARAYPEYKKKRRDDRTSEEKEQIHIMWDQVNLLQKRVLPEMGIACYRQTGLESDDLLAMAAARLSIFGAAEKEKQAVLITSDGDLYQCISPAVSWFDPQRNTYYTPESFKAKKGIDAARWGEVKTLAGCHSDNVKGIPGVGEGTAIKYLLGTLPPHHKTHQKIVCAEGKKIRDRNRGLVVLPHAKTKQIVLREPEYKPDVFFHYCERYGMRSFLTEERRKQWLSFFRDPLKGLRKRGMLHGQ